MIKLKLPPQVVGLMQVIGVTKDEAETTINDRHRGLADEGATRVVAVHWFSETRIVFVDAVVSERNVNNEENVVQFKELMASLVVLLSPQLPSGSIKRDMKMPAILARVADAFGHPVTASPDRPYSKLYSGQWDGGQLSLQAPIPDANFAITGTFNAEDKTANGVLAFNVDTYCQWLRAYRAASN